MGHIGSRQMEPGPQTLHPMDVSGSHVPPAPPLPPVPPFPAVHESDHRVEQLLMGMRGQRGQIKKGSWVIVSGSQLKPKLIRGSQWDQGT